MYNRPSRLPIQPNGYSEPAFRDKAKNMCSRDVPYLQKTSKVFSLDDIAGCAGIKMTRFSKSNLLIGVGLGLAIIRSHHWSYPPI